MRNWMGFLHPTQARLVKRSFNGPARVRGPAGTGKTVLLFTAPPGSPPTRPGRILSPPTSGTCRASTRPSTAISPRHRRPRRLHPPARLARTLLAATGNAITLDSAGHRPCIRTRLADGRTHYPAGPLRPPSYWRDEINYVIKGRGLRELADYEALDRRGRTAPLTDTLKQHVWRLRIAYDDNLDRDGIGDANDLLAAALDAITQRPPDPRLVRRAGRRSPRLQPARRPALPRTRRRPARQPVPRRRRSTSPLPRRVHPRRGPHLRHRPRRRAPHQLPQHPPNP